MTSEKLPAPRDFLLKVALYEEIDFEKEDGWKILDVLYFSGTYDSYCTKCKRDSTFQAVAKTRPPGYMHDLSRVTVLSKLGHTPEFPKIETDTYRVEARCTRYSNHTQEFFFFIDVTFSAIPNSSGEYSPKYKIVKVGQRPSFGDVHYDAVKKYSAVLTTQQLREFNRAIGLASHGVGIGSYVYLRRLFEALVEQAHISAKADSGWDDETYSRSRMSEKIGLLKMHLPIFLGDHPEMYGLLSKGVHELSEEECLAHFETLRIGIELILDEKIEQKEKDKKIKLAKAALANAIKPKT